MRSRFVNLRIPAGKNNTRRAELVVEGEHFVAIDSASEPDAGASDPAEERIDLRGALVLPGVIDGHVHFDDPGFTHRENFETGTRAAAAGGVSCIVDMPCTSLPPITSGASLHNKLGVISPKAHVDFMLWGGVCANSMEKPDWRDDLAEIAQEGVGSVKVYMLSGMDTFRDLGADEIRQVLRETERLGVPVGVHAEDRELVHELTDWLQQNGQNSLLDYAASRPAEAEINAVTTMRDLCRETGGRVHIVHVGTGRALDVIAEAKSDGLPMSGETCPHFLEFIAEDFDRHGASLKTAPVVKSATDRKRLWEGVVSGELDYVATDHAAGQWPEEKQTGNAWTDYGGIPGVELMLPYLHTAGVKEGRFTLERLTEITASAPARFFGIEQRKGRLAAGFDADFVVFDDAETWTVQAEDLHNLNRYTPHEGQTMTGRVRSLYVRGQRAFHRRSDGGENFAAPGTGEWVKRQSRVA
ncbi:MAG: allantoinase AllB [Acidobacteriota bacterium]